LDFLTAYGTLDDLMGFDSDRGTTLFVNAAVSDMTMLVSWSRIDIEDGEEGSSQRSRICGR
jgi:hypothetical protein